MQKKSPLILVLALCCLLLWIVFGAFTPLVQDEAYYFLWSHYRGAGFFDHPPFVAYMASGHLVAPDSVLMGRSGAIFTALLTLIASVRLFRVYGLRDNLSIATALILSQFSLLGLLGGFLTTPDSGLILCWVLAVTEAMLALQGQKKRWLLAGLFTGLGLWSKYTMLLIGPVFLWALIVEARKGKKSRGLLSPWPYLGGIVALLVFAPHLKWNADHDWITFKFQLRHGFSMERPQLESDGLPSPEPFVPGGAEALIANNFKALLEEQEVEELSPKPWDAALKKLNVYIGFYGSQVALWGALLIPIAAAWTRRRRTRKSVQEQTIIDESVGSRHMVIAAVAVPLIVFGTLSPFSKVEANWSAMYIVGAAALLARFLTPYMRRLGLYAVVNAALVGIVVWHASTGILPLRPHRDRVMNETHGYENLAKIVSSLDGYVFADSYQIVSMLHFYQPKMKVRQWPGITRPSEFLRRKELADIRLNDLETAGTFWLISTDVVPARIPGFHPVQMSQLRDCKGEEIQVLRGDLLYNPDERCKALVHEWYLTRYETSPVPFF